ncbi:MAG TPA: DUF2939 domain-containing protein [Chthoniobacterales bacterium]
MTDQRKTQPAPLRPVIAFVVAMLIAYVISPYVSFGLFARAIRSHNTSAIEWYVDFPAVRTALKNDLRGYVPKPKEAKKNDPLSGMFARVAPSLIDQLVDAFVTADGVAALITDPAVSRQVKAKDPAVVAHANERTHELKLSGVHYAFFSGLTTFVVEFEGKKLDFAFSHFRWRLKRIELPHNE